MTKDQITICQELTNLLGFRNFTKEGQRCTGKWTGTIDYSLVFDNHLNLFISNGMKGFYNRVQEDVDFIKYFNANKEFFLEQLKEQASLDNLISEKEGLLQVTVNDVNFCKGPNFSLWTYITLCVDGKTFNFLESSFNHVIRKKLLTEHLSQKNKKGIYTAGAVIKPTFIFGNVRFSHLDNLYKLNEVE